MKSLSVVSAVVMAALLSACSPHSGPASVAESPAASMTAEEASAMEASITESRIAVPDTSGYVGKWTGPEGTALTITQAASGYDVTVRNLDGPRTFNGTLEADGIHIVRDKVPVVIHKGDGKDTGMKWLADRHDCLVVLANEGYCRD